MGQIEDGSEVSEPCPARTRIYRLHLLAGRHPRHQCLTSSWVCVAILPSHKRSFPSPAHVIPSAHSSLPEKCKMHETCALDAHVEGGGKVHARSARVTSILS